jgi:hypothetical protein
MCTRERNVPRINSGLKRQTLTTTVALTEKTKHSAGKSSGTDEDTQPIFLD